MLLKIIIVLVLIGFVLSLGLAGYALMGEAQRGDPAEMIAPLQAQISQLEADLAVARDAGAQAASWIMLRLPREVSGLWQDWLAEHAPERADKIMSRLREMHGGKDYDPRWHHRMRGTGEYAEMIAARFRLAVKRLGLETAMPGMRTDLFRPPPRAGDQLSLF